MNKTLVIYYSFTGNSKTIASYIKEKLNADIIELSPVNQFSANYDEVVDEWQNNDIERDVQINKVSIDLNSYYKIILITCVWWYGISPVMKRFLKEYDLSGKDVIVAATNAGWIGHSLDDYELLLSKSNIKGKLNIKFSSEENKRHEMKTSYEEIDNWLEKLK